MCETSLRRIFIPPFQQLKEFRGHLAIWNCQLSVFRVPPTGCGRRSTLLIPSDFVVHSFRPPMEEAMSRLWNQLG